VDRLRIAWRWTSPDNRLTGADLRAAQHQVTPLVANGVLYTVTSLGQVAALDPDTGRTRWVFDPEGWRAGLPANMGFTRRGLAYWSDGRAERLILGTPDAYLISVDARTGKLDASFGRGGRVDLTVGIRDVKRATNYTVNSPPVVARDVIVIGSSIHDFGTTREGPPGDVRGYEVRSGKLLWTFHTIPRKGEPGYETWLDGSAEYTGGTNVWAPMTADEELGYVYLPTSTPTNDWYGGQRGGDNVYAESLVCLDVRTGRRVWHFQAIHHGLWDYDFPAAPILGDITVDGAAVKAVMQVSKQGFTYVFDRKTGRPVWPIEERPVPQSTVPGERTSPTQPFPTKPVPFERQGVTETEILDFTPELRARGLALLQQFEHGPLYTPPSERGTLVLPGAVGGANWGGAAFDPETQVLYVPSRTNPNVIRVVPGDPARTNMRYRREGLAMPTVDDLPIIKPPYSRVTAIDMSSGTHRWMVPLGDGPRRHPLLKDLNLPALGSNFPGSPLLTKTLLFVSINRVGTMRALPPVGRAEEGPAEGRDERRFLFVFDKTLGSLLRQIELPATSAGAPMTYLYRGAQYIVVAVGIAEVSELVALRLSPP
jgi:quinoprotein glucose dehydrogenase